MNYQNELEKIYSTASSDYTNLLDKEIVLYGAGSLGHMALDLLNKSGLRPKYFVDKLQTGSIEAIKIIRPDNIGIFDKENALFLICVCTSSYNDIYRFLTKLGIKHIIPFYNYAYLKFPQLLSNGWTVPNPTTEEKQEIEKVCKALNHDETSISHYLQFLWWKIKNIEKIYIPVLSGQKYFKSPAIPKLSDNEILLDAGCHFGQTIESFISATNKKYRYIYAFEPDKENLQICKNKFKDKRIIYKDFAISDTIGAAKFYDKLGFASKISESGNKIINMVSIDSLNTKATIIKLHIEGAELYALEGAKQTILKNRPIIMVMADHNKDGLYKIAKFLYELPGYKLYFNLHDYCGNTAVYYGIPSNKYKYAKEISNE